MTLPSRSLEFDSGTLQLRARPRSSASTVMPNPFCNEFKVSQTRLDFASFQL